MFVIFGVMGRRWRVHSDLLIIFPFLFFSIATLRLFCFCCPVNKGDCGANLVLFDIGIITNEDFLFAPIFLLIAEGGGVGDADVKNIFIVNCNDRGEWQYNDPKKLLSYYDNISFS